MPQQRVSEVISRHPYSTDTQREAYAAHLLAAGFPS
jgi:hypothetical protein